MKNILLLLFILIFLSACSPFSKYAGHTELATEEMYQLVYNEKVNLRSLTYGDVKFAKSSKEFKELNEGKPEFRNILFYAHTTEPDYEYYVLLNPREKEPDTSKFYHKEFNIDNQQFLFIISANAPQSDVRFIERNIRNLER